MALIISAATGNFNAGATWVGGIVPTVGDEARASTGHTITITANASCDEVSNAGTGKFVLNDGVTLTANVTSKSTTLNSNVLEFTANFPAQSYIVGNCAGGSSNSTRAVLHNSTGTLNITGNCTGGIVNSNCFGAINNSTGTLNITGNVASGLGSACHGVQNAGSGSVLLTGNATGSNGASAFGASNSSTGTLTVTGIATGGSIATSAGVNNASTGVVNLGRAKGNAYGPGNTSGLAASVGALNTGLGIIEIEQLEYGTYGMSPTSGTGIRLKKANTNVAVFNYADTAGAKTLIDATANVAMPAAADVRTGVNYASGALTGTCAVPAASSVGFGVPVDATTGTAALTPASVWDHLLSAITASSTIGTLLKTNIDATISSRSTLTAANVRTELAPELTEIGEIHAIHGLDIANALTVTPTLRAAGAITQAITGDGTTNTVVTRV